MNTLDTVQMAELLRVVCSNLNNASEEPMVVKSNQFSYRGRYWCMLESICVPWEIDHLSG